MAAVELQAVRAALVLPSQFPNGQKLAAQGVDTVYKEARTVTQASMDELRKFFLVGSMRDPSWTVSNDALNAMSADAKVLWAKQFAAIFSQDFIDHSSPSFGTSVKQCYGLLDAEYHSNLFMVEFFKAFRKLRNLRKVIWCPESMQGGWMEPDLVALINNDPNILIAKQNYTGAMKRIDGSVATKDLLARELRPEKITSMHSLRQGVEESWDGIIYLENWEMLP
jgi:hypothetical protein